jgi:hypothetical protein
MDEQLNPGELEEVIRSKEAHSRAVVLESVSIRYTKILVPRAFVCDYEAFV